MDERWTIVAGPDRYAFAHSYITEEQLRVQLLDGLHSWTAGDDIPEYSEAVISIRGAIPRGGGLRNTWVIWGQVRNISDSYWRTFRGTYNLATSHGQLHRISPELYDKLSANVLPDAW